MFLEHQTHSLSVVRRRKSRHYASVACQLNDFWCGLLPTALQVIVHKALLLQTPFFPPRPTHVVVTLIQSSKALLFLHYDDKSVQNSTQLPPTTILRLYPSLYRSIVQDFLRPLPLSSPAQIPLSPKILWPKDTLSQTECRLLTTISTSVSETKPAPLGVASNPSFKFYASFTVLMLKSEKLYQEFLAIIGSRVMNRQDVEVRQSRCSGTTLKWDR